MKLRQLLIVVLSLSVLSACSKDKDSKSNSSGITADGRCTDATVGERNNIAYKVRSLQANGTLTPEEVTSVLNSCNQLNSLIGSSSCTALNLETQERMTISGTEVQQFCQAVRGIADEDSDEDSDEDQMDIEDFEIPAELL